MRLARSSAGTRRRPDRGQVACRIARTLCRCASSSFPGFGVARPRLSTFSTVRRRPHSAGGSGGAGGTHPPSVSTSVDPRFLREPVPRHLRIRVRCRVGENVRQVTLTGRPGCGWWWLGERAGPVRARQPAPRRRFVVVPVGCDRLGGLAHAVLPLVMGRLGSDRAFGRQLFATEGRCRVTVVQGSWPVLGGERVQPALAEHGQERPAGPGRDERAVGQRRPGRRRPGPRPAGRRRGCRRRGRRPRWR